MYHSIVACYSAECDYSDFRAVAPPTMDGGNSLEHTAVFRFCIIPNVAECMQSTSTSDGTDPVSLIVLKSQVIFEPNSTLGACPIERNT